MKAHKLILAAICSLMLLMLLAPSRGQIVTPTDAPVTLVGSNNIHVIKGPRKNYFVITNDNTGSGPGGGGDISSTTNNLWSVNSTNTMPGKLIVGTLAVTNRADVVDLYVVNLYVTNVIQVVTNGVQFGGIQAGGWKLDQYVIETGETNLGFFYHNGTTYTTNGYYKPNGAYIAVDGTNKFRLGAHGMLSNYNDGSFWKIGNQ